MERLIALIFLAIFVDNFVFMRFFGICPFIGVSRKIETAIGMGMAVIFVMTMGSLVTWFIYHLILEPFALQYLQTIVFILVIASLVQLVEIVLRKVSPALYQGLGIFLPLITTNCAILAVALLNILEEFTLIESIVFGFAAAVGFTLALVIMAGLRERMEFTSIPKAFQGSAITLITAGILSIAFMGFRGMMSL